MCGCMPMHGNMDHEGHQSEAQSSTSQEVNNTLSAGMLKCAHCGFPMQPGYAYCPNCGMSLRTAVCPACGQKVDPSWSSCAYCGSPLTEHQIQMAHH